LIALLVATCSDEIGVHALQAILADSQPAVLSKTRLGEDAVFLI
jgi:hypothetical protein